MKSVINGLQSPPLPLLYWGWPWNSINISIFFISPKIQKPAVISLTKSSVLSHPFPYMLSSMYLQDLLSRKVNDLNFSLSFVKTLSIFQLSNIGRGGDPPWQRRKIRITLNLNQFHVLKWVSWLVPTSCGLDICTAS